MAQLLRDNDYSSQTITLIKSDQLDLNGHHHNIGISEGKMFFEATVSCFRKVVSIVPVVIVCLPHNFPYYIDLIHNANIPHALITAAKYVLAFPITYHYINGIRHLAWDWATGFSMKATYNSGYFVMTLALLVTAVFVNFF
ncbi:hypothetical protein KUTeg_006140 [Tegillarca granosa]|uniref:Succinate dehydrogenase cytochrome b560 subunit, mitochondrial n=1 Tax=Tegillarca granosa TaxID=220873 RepID=A0ABQ9FHJ1_TEGGR|nr:hypothetical protein KUTeg_006140 [Tegillarca granosa]